MKNKNDMEEIIKKDIEKYDELRAKSNGITKTSLVKIFSLEKNMGKEFLDLLLELKILRPYKSVVGRYMMTVEAREILRYKKNKNEVSPKSRKTISAKIRLYVWQRDKGKCVKCGKNEKLEYDHIIPISKGGSNTDRNVQLLCENCNRTKHNKIGD